MHEIFDMLLAVFDRAALMLICLFFLIRIRLFRELLHKTAHSFQRVTGRNRHLLNVRTVQYTGSGVPVEGSLVNVRIIAVMSGGILFGPWVGIITGVIAGVHRYLIDIGGVTAIPCFITSIIAGIMSGVINRKIPESATLARGDYRRHDLRKPHHDAGGGMGAVHRAWPRYRLQNRRADDPGQRLYRVYCTAGAER